MCDVLSMIKRCEVWNITRVDKDWAGRKVFFVVYVVKVLRWLKVHYKLAMGGAPQVAMRVASQIWQIVFASQTLQVFRLALRKKAQYVVVMKVLWKFGLLSFKSNHMIIGFRYAIPLSIVLPLWWKIFLKIKSIIKLCNTCI